jgi:hypothetical protein
LYLLILLYAFHYIQYLTHIVVNCYKFYYFFFI